MTDARFTTDGGPALIISGEGARPASVELVGSRARVTAVVSGRGKTWRAVLPLRASRWGDAELPLPDGDVRAADRPRGRRGDRRARRRCRSRSSARCAPSSTGWTVRIGPPIDPAYDSGEGQDALERRYATRPGALENAVFFESFYGRNASCNPLAIDRELARRAPGVTRYWSVVDLSVAVPEGAIPVVDGSPEWWRARGSARLLVVNDWLRRRFSRRTGQVVLQTWHGTPAQEARPAPAGIRPAPHGGGRARSRAAGTSCSRRTRTRRASSARRTRSSRRPDLGRGIPAQRRADERRRRGDASGARHPSRRARAAVRADVARRPLRDGRLRRSRGAGRRDRRRRAGARALAHAPAGAGCRRPACHRCHRLSRHVAAAARRRCAHHGLLVGDVRLLGDGQADVLPRPRHRALPRRAARLLLRPGRRTRRARWCARRTSSSPRSPDGDPAPHAARYREWREKFNARDDGHAAERVVSRILDQGFIDVRPTGP